MAKNVSSFIQMYYMLIFLFALTWNIECFIYYICHNNYNQFNVLAISPLTIFFKFLPLHFELIIFHQCSNVNYSECKILKKSKISLNYRSVLSRFGHLFTSLLLSSVLSRQHQYFTNNLLWKNKLNLFTTCNIILKYWQLINNITCVLCLWVIIF